MTVRVVREAQPSLADIVERLFGEFETRLDFAVVLTTVRRCRRELDVMSRPALPEVLERLARQRLFDLLAHEQQPPQRRR